MDTNFTTLLKQFIDCYIADPLAVEVCLLNAQQDIDSGVLGERYEGESDARTLSVKRAYQALRERLLLIDPISSNDSTSNAAKNNSAEPRVDIPEFSFELWHQKRFQAFLNKLAWTLEISREGLDEWIAERGYTHEQLAAIERDPEWQKKEAEYDFGFDSKPNLQVFLAKEFSEWLDVAVAKIEDLGEVSYRESIPAHLRQYLHQAYRCDLYGLDAACAALCGSILQEAIRIKLKKSGFSGLDEAIRDASEVGLLTPKAEEAAEAVRNLRNLAAHGKQQFLRSPEDRKKSSLPLTRELLDTIFTSES